MSAPADKIDAESLQRLRVARREFARAQLEADAAGLSLRRVALEVATAFDCEPEQLTQAGAIKRQ